MNKTFTNIYLEIWKHENDAGMVALHGDVINPNGGLNYIWFVMEEKEFRAFCTEGFVSIRDGMHHMDSFIDLVTIFDVPVPREESGKMECPFVRFNLPCMARKKFLLPMVENAWKECSPDESRKKIEISTEQVNDWIVGYGTGTGKVEVHMEPNVEEYLKEKLSEDMRATDKYDTLEHNLDRLKIIARNSTSAADETAHLYLSRDSNGFYWVARSPSNRMIMNGGVFRHSDENEPPRWSTHT